MPPRRAPSLSQSPLPVAEPRALALPKSPLPLQEPPAPRPLTEPLLRLLLLLCSSTAMSHPEEPGDQSHFDPLSLPPLSSGITGTLSSSFNLSPPSLLVSPDDVAPRRPHRRVVPTGDMPPAPSYNSAISTINKEATAAVQEAAMKGELTVPTSITEEQLEEMDVDAQLLQADIAQLKQRLSVKIRSLESVQARLRVARKIFTERKKKRKEERMAALRQQRAMLLRQQSEEAAAARPDPVKDLTTEGIEPNPGPPQPEDFIRAILIPPNGSPSETFVYVPFAEIPLFPHVPCITNVYGSFFLEGFHGTLRLYGAKPSVSDGETYVEENNFNQALHNRASRLLFTGPYLLVETSAAMDVGEEITTENVLGLLKFSKEWEQQVIDKLTKEERVSPPDSPRFDPSSFPVQVAPDSSSPSPSSSPPRPSSPSSSSRSSSPVPFPRPSLEPHAVKKPLPTHMFDCIMQTQELIRKAAMHVMIYGHDEAVDFPSMARYHGRLFDYFETIFTINTRHLYGLELVKRNSALRFFEIEPLEELVQDCIKHIRTQLPCSVHFRRELEEIRALYVELSILIRRYSQ